MTEATDANHKTTRYAYDSLGRLISVTDPLGSVVSSYAYAFGNPMTTVQVDTLLDRTAGTYQSSVEFIDGLGRTRLIKGQAEDGKILAGGWQTFTPQGKTKASYDSFVAFKALYEFESAPGNAPVTRSTYDILGRPLSVTPPAVGGTTLPTRMLYPRPWETRSFDERDAQEQNESYPAISQVDGLGRVSRIIKYNDLGDGSPTPLVWGIGYDTLGNIRWISDPAYDLDSGANPAEHCHEDGSNQSPHVRCYWYNSLKQIVRLQDPHIGQVAYYYDALGNLARRVDALGQEQLFDYGPANRLAAVTAEHDASDKADYRYDFHYDETGPRNADATNLLGRVSWIEWPHGVDAFSYDDLGRNHRSIAALWNPSASPEDDQQRDVFAKELAFDATGKVIAESLPGGLHLGYQYNLRGLLNTVTAGFDGKPASVLASNLQYDHHGAMTRAQLGNGNGVCAWYDARGRRTEYKAGRLSETLTLESLCGAQGRDLDPNTKDPSVFLHNRYTHGFDGLIDKIEDLTDPRADIPRADAAFNYDRLYELTRAQVGAWTYNYRYDKLQNLTSQQTDLLNDRIVKAIGDEPFEYGTNGPLPTSSPGPGTRRLRTTRWAT